MIQYKTDHKMYILIDICAIVSALKNLYRQNLCFGNQCQLPIGHGIELSAHSRNDMTSTVMFYLDTCFDVRYRSIQSQVC